MATIKPIHKYDCDVLIVGGGPSGSALAYYLASAGLEVVVAEAQRFPRDKTCGDAVSPVALAELHKIGITASDEFKKTNQVKKVSLFIEQEEMTVDLVKQDHLPFHGRVISRIILDNWVADAAKKAGALYMEDTRLTAYSTSSDYVFADLKTNGATTRLKSKMIIGADGSNSTVSRILNGVKPKESYQLLGLRAYYQDTSGPTDRCDIFFSKQNFPGLFWFFPTGDGGANIGSAMIAKTLPKNHMHVNEILNDQIQKNVKLAERVGSGKVKGKVSGWPLTFRNQRDPVVGQRVLLVGDAAGLINPLSGDGIQYALLSARWAAETLIKCFEENNLASPNLEAYTKRVADEMAYDLALSNLLIQITRNRTFTGLWLEVLLILIERARVDKEYAGVIAGIFDGSLPSYKALDPQFILKSLMQGSIHIGSRLAAGISSGPGNWMNGTKHVGNAATNILNQVMKDPKEQVKWLAEVAGKGITVGQHIFRSFKKQADPS